MAGTDVTRLDDAGNGPPGPAIILVQPQLGENIGMAARAMLNCSLTELRLVRPRDGWPSDAALSAASGADRVIAGARLFDTVEGAVSDLHLLFAATARPRGMTKTVMTPAAAAADLSAQGGARSGVLFGPEAKGLGNDHVALCDAVIQVPLHPGFSSLNLAQAVLIIAYEWFKLGDETPERELHMAKTRPADKGELLGLFEQLERELDACGFLHVAEKRPIMVRNLRNLLQRARLTEQEVRTLRGVVSGLSGNRAKKD